MFPYKWSSRHILGHDTQAGKSEIGMEERLGDRKVFRLKSLFLKKCAVQRTGDENQDALITYYVLHR